jgi:hypothetical protein
MYYKAVVHTWDISFLFSSIRCLTQYQSGHSTRRCTGRMPRALNGARERATRLSRAQRGWGGRVTLQGSWRVVLGCRPGSSEELTACCSQALARGDVVGVLRHIRVVYAPCQKRHTSAWSGSNLGPRTVHPHRSQGVVVGPSRSLWDSSVYVVSSRRNAFEKDVVVKLTTALRSTSSATALRLVVVNDKVRIVDPRHLGYHDYRLCLACVGGSTQPSH